MNERKFKVLWLLISFFIYCNTFAFAQAANQSDYLSQEQLTQIPKLLKKIHDASEIDKKKAEELLKIADASKTESKWGIATKAYGESTMIRPSIRSLLGLSISIANIPRKREKCIDEITAKLKDFSTAIDYMQVAIALSQKISADESTILKYQNELLSAYERIINKHTACSD